MKIYAAASLRQAISLDPGLVGAHTTLAAVLRQRGDTAAADAENRRAQELFKLSDFKFFETDLIGVELSADPQPYVQICMALLQAELNIHYTYPLLYRGKGRGAIALHVDDVETGLKILADKGHRIITENDLLEYDENY